MNTETMAEKEQIARQNDIFGLENKDFVCEIESEHGKGMLFKDGSTLEYADEYQAGTVVSNPSKEIKVEMVEEEGEYILKITDQKYSKKLSESSNNAHLRVMSISNDNVAFSTESDESFNSESRRYADQELTDYLSELNLTKNTLETAVSLKNQENENKSILSFVKNVVKGFKSDTKEENKSKRKNQFK